VKVLLDENVPHDLRPFLAHHETFTVVHMGWGGVKNGKLLEAAERAGFDVLITGDKTLEYEQNLSHRRIALVALSAVNWPIIEPHLAKIVDAWTMQSLELSPTLIAACSGDDAISPKGLRLADRGSRFLRKLLAARAKP
jgi:hypothetical protein